MRRAQAPWSSTISILSSTSVLETEGCDFGAVTTHAPDPQGQLSITPEMLLAAPSGNLFGLSQNAGMRWSPAHLLDPEFLILSTHGGIRAKDGTPIALGFHTGHREVGLLVAEAARELRSSRAIPFTGAVTAPRDGRTQGTAGMLDSLPFRNDASTSSAASCARSPPATLPASSAPPPKTGPTSTARSHASSMPSPTAPGNFATVQVFLAGGVPEVRLHLRSAGLLDTSVRTVTGETRPEIGRDRLGERPSRPDLAPHPDLPDDTRLWAALVQASSAVWGGASTIPTESSRVSPPAATPHFPSP